MLYIYQKLSFNQNMENYKLKIIIKFFESTYKNGGKNIKFGYIEIKKQKFLQHKRPISIKNVDINSSIYSSNSSNIDINSSNIDINSSI